MELKNVTKKTVKCILFMAVGLGVSLCISDKRMDMKETRASTFDKYITGLGVSELRNPEKNEYGNYESGSRVCFGSYLQSSESEKEAIIWNVLDTGTDEYSADKSKTLLLEATAILDKIQFNESEDIYEDSMSSYLNDDKSKLANDYRWCNARKWLNSKGVWKGADRYTKDGFYNTAFSEAEKTAITVSVKSGDLNNQINGLYNDKSGLSQDGTQDKVFLLSYSELSNLKYGHCKSDGKLDNISKSYTDHAKRCVTGEIVGWGLRTGNEDNKVTRVNEKGTVESVKCDATIGISPAINIDLNHILFTSMPSRYGGLKLTIIDPTIEIDLADNAQIVREGNTVTIPFAISGDMNRATGISYLVTKGEYNQKDAEIVSYGQVADIEEVESQDYIQLDLQSIRGDEETVEDMLGECSIYIFTEYINVDDPNTWEIDESRLTDYASKPLKIDIPDAVNCKEKMITGIGVNSIIKPRKVQNAMENWMGNYVYFGSYWGERLGDAVSIRWRVLDNDATEFSVDNKPTLLLDADQILDTEPFNVDEDAVTNEENGKKYTRDNQLSNLYEYSSLRKWLNAEHDRYNSDFWYSGFSYNAFTDEEIEVMHVSKKNSKKLDWETELYAKDDALSINDIEDRLFILGMDEITNSKYGYYANGLKESNNSIRKKKTTYAAKSSVYNNYLLRTKIDENGTKVGCVNDKQIQEVGSNGVMGISPACNLDVSKILFTSLVAGEVGKMGAEYKLTVIDDCIEVNSTSSNVETIGRNGDIVTIPYSIDGYHAHFVNQLSYLLTDKNYAADDVNVKAYGRLAQITKDSLTGQVQIDLEDLAQQVSDTSLEKCTVDTLEKEYKLYIVAEKIHVEDYTTSMNDYMQTDYAGKPAVVKIPYAESDMQPDDSDENRTTSSEIKDEKTSWDEDETTMLEYKADTVEKTTELPTKETEKKQESVKKEASTSSYLENGMILTGKNGEKYKVNNIKKATVTYYKMANKGNSQVVIPSRVVINSQKYIVTEIEDKAFKNNKKLSRVVIGDNIRIIGKSAFEGCTNMKSVKIGSNVRTIKQRAFYGCNKLAQICIPKRVTDIGNLAFANCNKLRKIDIKTVKLNKKHIGKNIFKGIAKNVRFTAKRQRKDYIKLF